MRGTRELERLAYLKELLALRDKVKKWGLPYSLLEKITGLPHWKVNIMLNANQRGTYCNQLDIAKLTRVVEGLDNKIEELKQEESI